MVRTFLYGLLLGGMLTMAWWFTRNHPTVARVSETLPAQLLSTPAETNERPNIEQLQDSIMYSRRTAITRVVETATPAVVGINVTAVQERLVHSPFNDPFFRGFFPPEVIRQRVQSIGSGFLISPDGYILSCDHVVENATEIVVTLPGGKQEKAKIIGTDRVSDIALLKVEGTNYPFVKLCTTSAIVGEWAIAMGNPFGLFNNNVKPSVSVGVVSTVGQDFDRNREGRIYREMLQTDAAINSGNSGGPLLNALGEVIGMNTMIYTPVQNQEGVGPSAGVGFAIPAYRLKETIAVLKQGKKLNRDFYTGLTVQNLDLSMIAGLGLKDVRGILVSDVVRKSPADRAGVAAGDVITMLDEYDMTNVNSLQRALDRLDLKVGDVVRLKILRNGKTLTKELTLEPYRR